MALVRAPTTSTTPLLHHLLCILLIPLHLLPGPSLAHRVDDGVMGVSQAVQQLTQRFATLEVSLESRLARLDVTAAKGEAVMEALELSLAKVDSLVEKVEGLDARLSTETSTIRTTAATTTTHIQGMSSRLERLESLVRSSGGGGGRGGSRSQRQGTTTTTTTNNNRHDTRSPGNPSGSDAQLSALVRGSVREAVQQALDDTLTTFHNTLYKRLSKSVGELQQAVTEARVGLEDLGTRTLATAAEARQDIQHGGKTTQEAVRDIRNNLHTVHQDLAHKITSPPSLHTLGPVLRQVNHSVVESITRATQSINVTSLLDQAVSRREHNVTGSITGGLTHRNLQETHVLHCADPSTVAALLEVKQLLQTLLKKSEDLRRSLTKQTNHGLDLLTLLQQRISVIMRRMNTEPDQSQLLVSEMQDLGILVESSYMAVLVAQNAFIDSCKRIQDEEPMLELKMTEILDKLVTNIDLGYQHNHQQLSELKEVVQRMEERAANFNMASQVTQGDDDYDSDEVRDDEGYETQQNTSLQRVVQARTMIQEAVGRTNSTVESLEEVEARVDELSAQLVDTDWSNIRQQEPADNLVTAAKDLKGFAQEQIINVLDLHEALLAALEHMDSVSSNPEVSTGATTNNMSANNVPSLPEVHLRSDTSTTFTLPPSCTAALVSQIQSLSQSQSSFHPTSMIPTEEEGEGELEVVEEEEEEFPAWFTSPIFLSGNYGTPDLQLPVFREDEWVDMDEVYPAEDTATQISPTPITHTTHIHRSAPPPPNTNQLQPSTTDTMPRAVDRFFGVVDTSSTSSRRRS